jgi:hypothetical protein
LEEDNLIGPIARGINVSKAQNRTIYVEGEINSKNIPRRGGVGEIEDILVLGGHQTAQSTDSVNRHERAQGGRKKMGCFSRRNWAEFRFLESNQVGPGRQEVSGDRIAFIVVAQTSDILGCDEEDKIIHGQHSGHQVTKEKGSQHGLRG